jgi:L-threonylcarbamoyladenylate synthase
MPTLDTRQLDRSWILEAVGILRRGGLVAFPTETVYGLGARALDPAALGRVFEAKGRPKAHPLIAHVLGIPEARRLAASWPSAAERLAVAFWPGPLTLVVPRAMHVPLELTGGADSVAVRAPSHPVVRHLLEALGEPIAAPSANRYQSVSPTTAAHVARSLGDRVDLILDGGPCQAGIESSVVDVRGPAPLLLRRGALDLPALQTIEPGTIDASFAAKTEDALRPAPGMDLRHYAPRTELRLASSRAAALAEVERRLARGEHVALLLITPDDDSALAARGATVLALGPSSEAYAHQLYAALHDLDEMTEALSVIVVEPVPDTAEWAAIADRLRRGSSVA